MFAHFYKFMTNEEYNRETVFLSKKDRLKQGFKAKKEAKAKKE